MKKFLMAAVALICMAMTSVVFTSCGSDKDDSPVNKEYTLKVSLEMISEGELSRAALEYMNKEFNQEVTNKFTGFMMLSLLLMVLSISLCQQ